MVGFPLYRKLPVLAFACPPRTPLPRPPSRSPTHATGDGDGGTEGGAAAAARGGRGARPHQSQGRAPDAPQALASPGPGSPSGPSFRPSKLQPPRRPAAAATIDGRPCANASPRLIVPQPLRESLLRSGLATELQQCAGERTDAAREKRLLLGIHEGVRVPAEDLVPPCARKGYTLQALRL